MTKPNENIVNRVVERLKAQPLGDLITEEDLHDIVKEAIPKVFFEPRFSTEGSGWNEKKVAKDPYIVEILRELLKEEASKVMENYLKEKAPVLNAYWQKVLDQGLYTYINQLQENQANTHLKKVLNDLIDTLNQERSRNGQSQLFHIY